jgi:dephospho-CoA kinase
MRFGLVGKNGSGKTSVCKYLETKGFKVLSLSDIVRIEAKKQGLELSRDNLIKTGNYLKNTFGPAILAERSFEEVKNSQKPVVFDSIRNPAEIVFLKEKGVNIIGIEADLKIRFARIKDRGQDTDKIDFKTFTEHDARESNGQSSGQNINACLKLCETIIENSGTYEELTQKIDNVLLGTSILK